MAHESHLPNDIDELFANLFFRLFMAQLEGPVLPGSLPALVMRGIGQFFAHDLPLKFKHLFSHSHNPHRGHHLRHASKQGYQRMK